MSGWQMVAAAPMRSIFASCLCLNDCVLSSKLYLKVVINRILNQWSKSVPDSW